MGSKITLRKELGLSEDKFTVLLMGGVEGVGKIYNIVEKLDNVCENIQMIACTGKNKKLYDRLKSLNLKNHLKVYEYTEEMAKIMKASDVLVTKAGAASVFEAIESNLPMIIYSYVPGQEAGTPGWVVKKGFGKYLTKPKRIAATIDDWIRNDKTAKFSGNMIKYGKENSTYEIVDAILELTE